MVLVLRLFAVYGAATALALFAASRLVRRIRLSTALLLAAAPLLLVGKAFVTAGVHAPLDITYEVQPLAPRRSEMGISAPSTPVLVDVVNAYIPWRKAVREAIENGRLPLWNRFQLGGEPLLAAQEPAAFHPFTAIGLLLPLPQSWTLEMALRLFLALLCAYLFFAELGAGEIPALLGALGWAFSDFLVFYLGFPLGPAAAPLPLLLLGLRRLAREQNRGAVALTVAALVLVVTAGHPETLLHVVAAGGIWFVFELARSGRGRRLRPIVLSLAAGVIAVGLCAIVLMPFFEVLPHTREQQIRTAVYATAARSVPLTTSARFALQNAMPYAFGVSGRGGVTPGFEVPAGYAGAILFPLAFAGLASRRREKFAFATLAALGLALHARLPVVADAVARLPLFELALNERMAFLAAFGIAALAVLGAEWLARGEGRRAFALAAAGAAVLLGGLFALRTARWDELAMSGGYRAQRIALQLGPLVLGGAAVVFGRRRTRGAVAAVVALFAAARVPEISGVYPTDPARAFYPRLPILEKLPRDGPWRTAPIGYVFVPNMSSLYELEDVRGYVSLTLAPLAETFPIWCVPRPVEWNRVADPTTPFLAFLNVRWVIAPSGYATPPGWRLLAEGPEGRLLENLAVLPRAFAPRSLRYERQPAREIELLAKIRDFAAEGIVEAAPPSGAARDTPFPNGRAEVWIARYRADELELEIDAREKTFVGTSIPRWPGWKLSIDGRPRPLAGYNRAFVGFGVEPGRHTATLRYRPDGFTLGAAVTGATLLVSLVLFALPRRRGIG